MADLGNIDVHGFASQGYMETTDYNYITPSLKGSFAISEYAINVGSDLSDDLRVGIQFFGRNLGNLGNNEVGVDWAFGDYRKYGWLGVRAGRVKTPWGLYNESADFDHVRTSVLMPQSVYDVRLREYRTATNGINPYGYLDGRSLGGLEYSAVFGFITHPTDGSVAAIFNDIPLFTFDKMENKYSFAIQAIWNTPISGLRIAHTLHRYASDLTLQLIPPIAAFYGIDPEVKYEGNAIDANVSSVEYSRGNLLLAAEYNVTQGDFPHPYFPFEQNSEDYYVQGSYRVNHWFELGSYYSVHNDDRDNRDGEGYDPVFNAWQKDLALSLRFDISPNMIFKLEGHQMDGINSVRNSDNPAIMTDPDSMEQNWYMFASKVSFVF
jgi:hypothetical protein